MDHPCSSSWHGANLWINRTFHYWGWVPRRSEIQERNNLISNASESGTDCDCCVGDSEIRGTKHQSSSDYWHVRGHLRRSAPDRGIGICYDDIQHFAIQENAKRCCRTLDIDGGILACSLGGTTPALDSLVIRSRSIDCPLFSQHCRNRIRIILLHILFHICREQSSCDRIPWTQTFT